MKKKFKITVERYGKEEYSAECKYLKIFSAGISAGEVIRSIAHIIEIEKKRNDNPNSKLKKRFKKLSK